MLNVECGSLPPLLLRGACSPVLTPLTHFFAMVYKAGSVASPGKAQAWLAHSKEVFVLTLTFVGGVKLEIKRPPVKHRRPFHI